MIAVIVAVGELYRSMAQRAAASVRRMTGLDCVVLSNPPAKKPAFGKLLVFRQIRGTVLLLDADTFITAPWDVSSFEGTEALVAVADLPSKSRDLDCAHYSVDPEKYFNSGVIIANSEHHTNLFEAAYSEAISSDYRTHFRFEQTALNVAAQRASVSLKLLPRRYNWVPLPGAPMPDDLVVLHGAGGGRAAIEALINRVLESKGNNMLCSGLCHQAQHESPTFRQRVAELVEPWKLHRKQWEFAFILQALGERNLLEPGRRGLGLGVGIEPLPARFAGLGVEVIASDLNGGWFATNKSKLARPALCNPAEFDRLVSFRSVDMNWIPEDLRRGNFDFVWSACSIDHVGSIRLLKRCVYKSLECLAPGGVAVHTTEYLHDREYDHDSGPTVRLVKQDVQEILLMVRNMGCRCELDWTIGDGPADLTPDPTPDGVRLPHLRRHLEGKIWTSVALLIERPS
jgi:hypothetical protein